MKYRYTFFLIGGEKVSIDANDSPALDAVWLNLSGENTTDKWTLRMENVTHIRRETLK